MAVKAMDYVTNVLGGVGGKVLHIFNNEKPFISSDTE
jgi:hypothetical protein